jgi:predicted cupin superfamily sugar epimerase
MSVVKDLMAKYNLLPHPEGGSYKETYRSDVLISKDALPKEFGGDRNCSTAIYFLLEKGSFSAFHRIKSDECWHFYAGQTLFIYVIGENGELKIIKLGNDINKGEVFQAMVPANSWFASEPASESNFSFVGCTVSPGFDFVDFELAQKTELGSQYPDHAGIITRLCRQ